MLILGQGALRGSEGAAVLGLARKLADSCNLVREDWNGFNVLHAVASRVGGLDLGLVPGKGGRDVAGMVKAAASGELRPSRRPRMPSSAVSSPTSVIGVPVSAAIARARATSSDATVKQSS